MFSDSRHDSLPRARAIDLMLACHKQNYLPNTMQRILASLLPLTVGLMFMPALATQAADKIDPNGTWKWSVTG